MRWLRRCRGRCTRVLGRDGALCRPVIRTLFEAIHHLTTPPTKPRREIGFHIKEDSVPYRVNKK